jgi:hypothetical protein
VGIVRSPFLLGLVGTLVSFIYRRCDHACPLLPRVGRADFHGGSQLRRACPGDRPLRWHLQRDVRREHRHRSGFSCHHRCL